MRPGVTLLLASRGWAKAIADAQLRRIPAAPVGAGICDTGLWGWSRHPELFLRISRLVRLSS